jgi:hypothetical protein
VGGVALGVCEFRERFHQSWRPIAIDLASRLVAAVRTIQRRAMPYRPDLTLEDCEYMAVKLVIRHLADLHSELISGRLHAGRLFKAIRGNLSDRSSGFLFNKSDIRSVEPTRMTALEMFEV